MSEPLVIRQRDSIAIATIMARKNADHAAIAKALGCAARAGPGRVSGDRWSIIGTGPDTWLALDEAPCPQWRETLERDLEGLASVSDQSGAYLLFRIGGANARDLLQRGVFIDLDASQFGPGCSAVTTIGHVDVILWQLNELPEFEAAVLRSFAASFRHWLDVSARTL